MESTTWFDHPSLELGLGLNIGPTVPLETKTRRSMDLVKDEVIELEAELDRVNEENKRLNGRLAAMQANYAALQSRLVDFVTAATAVTCPPSSSSLSPTRKRKCESADRGSASSEETVREEEAAGPRISKLCVRTEASDTSLVVKDGYQWRKYGQKVTRDNPCPRAYYRCSFAPACRVKKRVQRSAEDRSVLVATYEGEHDHARPPTPPAPASDRPPAAANAGSPPRPVAAEDSARRPRPVRDDQEGHRSRELAERMASSLTKDPSFAMALAAAISGRFLGLSPDNN